MYYVNNTMRVAGKALKVIVALAMIVAVIAIGVFLFRIDIKFGSGSGASSGGKAIPFTVQPGDTVDSIGENLKQKGVIDSPFFFKLQVKMQGAEQDFKAGQFQLSTGMDTDKLIKTLTTSPTEVGQKFTIIEGVRVEEIAQTLAKNNIVDEAGFLQKAGTPEGAAAYVDDFLQASGKPADKGLEGYLFPDTYEIKPESGDKSDQVIRTMLGAMESKITPEMRQEIAGKGRTVHQVLTIASIVQREGQKKEELPIIASVFWNRLAEDPPMRLDADPTAQYALGNKDNWWPQLNLAPGDVDSPYNTYRIQGMPPAPICNPGLDAIKAAVSPAETKYLYFVAKGESDPGAHAFASTLAEHEANRLKYGNR